MDFGLLVYWRQVRNIGDYVQSLAAKQFLPRVDFQLNRETLSQFDRAQVALILNSWFIHTPQNWPPSRYIHPLFVSFHISHQVRDKLTSPQAIEYYKQYEPIGCRDLYTHYLLKSKGVDAYFSGCLTLTLNKNDYVNDTYNSDVLLVDVLYNYGRRFALGRTARQRIFNIMYAPFIYSSQRLKKTRIEQLIPNDILADACVLNQEMDLRELSHEQRFALATEFLQRLANAKLVITSRIHTALPCLAFGTPVLFVDGGLDNVFHWGRIMGLVDMMNVVTVSQIMNDDVSIDWENIRNSDDYVKYREGLIRRVSEFVEEKSKL